MTLTDILFTIIIQVLFCLGLRQLLSEGMILHFIRKPFQYDKHKTVMNLYIPHTSEFCIFDDDSVRILTKRSKILGYILKPIILCVVCFASVWGGSLFIALHGFLPIPLIICCVSSTFIIRAINDKVDW